MSQHQRLRAAALSLWSHPVEPQPLAGGLSNTNFLVTHRGERLVVRLGDDVPEHNVFRTHEHATSRAAHAAGLSPEVVHAEPGALVLRFIAGRPLSAADVRDRATLARVLPLLRACHHELPRYLHGARPTFSPFATVRDYAALLVERASPFAPRLPPLLSALARLERAVGAQPQVFCHNDLLAANWIDDGARLWLIDWEYAGFNAALFDLAGLASNSELAEPDETWLLEQYFERPATAETLRQYAAMKCVSLLREASWGMVSQVASPLAIDYAAYAEDYLGRFARALSRFEEG